MSKMHKIGNTPIKCHAFNADCSQVAISANNNEIQIYSINVNAGGGVQSKLNLLHTLVEHQQIVTGLDWAPKTNRLVSCSADRNAYVWNFDGNTWKPTLVVLMTDRAAICVRFSPNENKFAVGCGSRSVAVCYFDAEHNWWSARHIKKGIRSTITAVDWHPDNNIIACGSTDFKVRIYSAAMKEAGDSKPGLSRWALGGTKMSFGNLLFEASSEGGGWVHSVSFSSDGNRLAWVGHDSTVNIALTGAYDNAPPVVLTSRHSYLPYTSVTWVGSETLVCAGHDCVPMLYHAAAHNITVLGPLDKSTGVSGAGQQGHDDNGADNDGSQSIKINAFKKFQDIDRLRIDSGNSNNEIGGASLNSIHQNTINEVRQLREGAMVSTIGRDGILVLWDLDDLSRRMKHVKII